MLFTLVTKNEYTDSNPLIKNVINDLAPSESIWDEIYIIDSFMYAIELGFDANYLNDKVYHNVYWSDAIDETIKSIIVERAKDLKISPVFSTKYIDSDSYIEYENEDNIILYGRWNPTVYVSEKNISGYFLEIIKIKDTFSYRNEFRRELKNCGFVEKQYTLQSIVSYMKQLFGEKYIYFMGIIFKSIWGCIRHFDAEKQSGDDFFNSWDNLFKVEEYFSNVKIYGVEQSPNHDFPFQKDENGEYYVQYEYNASESVTGRMFPINIKGYQALQTLPKESRHLLKAEKGCMLLEYDYKGFELALLACIYSKEFGEDSLTKMINPHETICTLFNVDPILYRAKGKEINYAIIYGMTLNNLVKLIHEKFGIVDAVEIINKIEHYELYNKSVKLCNHLYSNLITCNDKKFIRNVFNRGIKIEKEHALLNNYISSTAADYVYLKAWQIIKLFEGSEISKKNKILLQNHDSLLIQLETSIIINTTISETLDHIMKSPVLGYLLADVELKTGTDWGNMS